MGEVCHTSGVENPEPKAETATTADEPAPARPVAEIGGRKDGTDPTRFGDWEKHGRCIDF